MFVEMLGMETLQRAQRFVDEEQRDVFVTGCYRPPLG